MASILERVNSYNSFFELNTDPATRLELVRAELAALEETGVLKAMSGIREQLSGEGRDTYTVLRAQVGQPVDFDVAIWEMADTFQTIILDEESDGLPVMTFDLLYNRKPTPKNGVSPDIRGEFNRVLRADSSPLGVQFSHISYQRPFPDPLTIPNQTWGRDWNSVSDWTTRAGGDVGNRLSQFYAERFNGVK